MEETEMILVHETTGRTWGKLVHILSAVFMVIPFANLLLPLVVLTTKGKDNDFVEFHAKESLNFQIFILLFCILPIITFESMFGKVLMGVAFGLNIVFSILAARQAAKGEEYKYPVSMRIIY